jgi:hypothetical protein
MNEPSAASRRGDGAPHPGAPSATCRGARRSRAWLGCASALAFAAVLDATSFDAKPAPFATKPIRSNPTASPLGIGAEAWRHSSRGAIRGVTIGPIENALHPGVGYGTDACARTLIDVKKMGATWVSFTPFGRAWNGAPTGIDPSFEAPFAENRVAIARAVEQAHAEGLRVLLVPHLWVETGVWRGDIDLGDDAAWQRWAAAYRKFVLTWAKIAADASVDMFSMGVELRSFVTTVHAPLFSDIIHDVRAVYPGLLTYAANWDDVERTPILGELDVIGLNAFFPLSLYPNASRAELARGGHDVERRVEKLAESWQKPVMFTEIGYTTREDPAFKPWLWPDTMSHVAIDEQAQADAYTALVAPLLDAPWFAGFFVWRVFSDPDDVSQEGEWGFSPRGKLAELVIRDAFHAHWAADGSPPFGDVFAAPKAEYVGDE